MVERFEAPKLEDLVGLPLAVSFLEEPWIVAVVEARRASRRRRLDER